MIDTQHRIKCIASVFGLMLFFSTSSCVFSNCKQKNLPKSEKAWFKNYALNQKYLFKSNQGRADTIRVVDVMDDYTPCNKFELSDYQFNIQKVGFESNILGRYIYAKFNITESNETERGFMFIDLYGYYVDDEINECSDNIKINLFSDSIHAYTFNHTNAKSEGDGIIHSFSWSKEHGIVRYETTEGEVFERIK